MYLGPGGRARAGDFLKQARHQVGVARLDDPLTFLGHRRGRLDQHLALLVGDARDQVRIDPHAAIGKDRIACHHLHRRHRAGAQSHRQIGWIFFRVKTKARDPAVGVLRAHALQDPDGDHVLGLLERGAHRHLAFKLSVVVLRRPGRAAVFAGLHRHLGVADNGRAAQPFLQGGRVDEGFEARARLAPCLGHVVEFVLAKIEAADQGPNGAVARVHRHQRAFNFGQLRNLPAAVGRLENPDHRSPSDGNLWRRFGSQTRLHGFEALAADL